MTDVPPIVGSTLNTARAILGSGQELQPIIVMDHGGQPHVAPLFMDKSEWKPFIQFVLKKTHADEFVFVSSGWAATIENEEELKKYKNPASDHPNRRSVAQVMLFRRGKTPRAWNASYTLNTGMVDEVGDFVEEKSEMKFHMFEGVFD